MKTIDIVLFFDLLSACWQKKPKRLKEILVALEIGSRKINFSQKEIFTRNCEILLEKINKCPQDVIWLTGKQYIVQMKEKISANLKYFPEELHYDLPDRPFIAIVNNKESKR